MLIQDWMNHDVRSIKPRDSIEHARDIMESNRINQLPVLAGGKLVGIVTDRNLRDAFPSVFDAPPFGKHKAPAGANPKEITVEMVMTPHVLTLSPTTSIIEAARIMRRERIGAIPIVDGTRLVGILARSDVLDAFVALAERSATT